MLRAEIVLCHKQAAMVTFLGSRMTLPYRLQSQNGSLILGYDETFLPISNPVYLLDRVPDVTLTSTRKQALPHTKKLVSLLSEERIGGEQSYV